MSNKLKDKLDGLGVEVIQQLEDDLDSNGHEIHRYDCKLGDRSVTVEYYANGDLMVTYDDDDSVIYDGYVG